MALPVELSAVVEEMDVPNDDWTAYINRRTGELATVSGEEQIEGEPDEEGENLPEWQAELNAKAAEVLADKEFIELPGKFEIHEYSIMERFCRSLDDQRPGDVLLGAIQGRGAFRRFKDLIHREGIEDDWYAYRDEAIGRIAAGFLEVENIAFTTSGPSADQKE